MHADLYQPSFARAAQNAVLERAAKKVGENRQNVNTHGVSEN
jgi:hypothetical protein